MVVLLDDRYVVHIDSIEPRWDEEDQDWFVCIQEDPIGVSTSRLKRIKEIGLFQLREEFETVFKTLTPKAKEKLIRFRSLLGGPGYELLD